MMKHSAPTTCGGLVRCFTAATKPFPPTIAQRDRAAVAQPGLRGSDSSGTIERVRLLARCLNRSVSSSSASQKFEQVYPCKVRLDVLTQTASVNLNPASQGFDAILIHAR